MSGGGVIVLDGARLAASRAPVLAARAQRVRERRGDPPRLLLVAWGARGKAPHIDRKIRAAAGVGVDALPLIFSPDTSIEPALARIRTAMKQKNPDGVFLQFPFPAGIDEQMIAADLPPALDVDVMTAARLKEFFRDRNALPPVTVSAGLELLDQYNLQIEGLQGVVVAPPSPFTLMFREALARRGAFMYELIAVDAEDRSDALQRAGLVVVATAQPGSVRSGELAANTIAIDVGYFNPGGRGDIDTSSGIDHLKAIAPVPGGIGPMTISMLLERVILFAENRMMD